MLKYVNCGHLVESFAIFPCISLNWMHKTNSTPLSWEFNIAWFFWYFSIGNVKSNLKKARY